MHKIGFGFQHTTSWSIEVSGAISLHAFDNKLGCKPGAYPWD